MTYFSTIEDPKTLMPANRLIGGASGWTSEAVASESLNW